MEGCLARIFLFLLPSLAWADAVNNEWFSTTRALSMGNVGIASAEDSATAMFYNPAALSRSKRTVFEPFRVQFDMGEQTLLEAGLEIGNHLSLAKVRPSLQDSPQKVSSLGASFYPNVGGHGFAFGILARAWGTSYYDGTKLHYQAQQLLVPSFGLSVGLIGGLVRIGGAVRGLQLTSNNRTAVKDAPSVGYTTDAGEGLALAGDGGVLISIPIAMVPTIGVTARNIGDSTFKSKAKFSRATGVVTRHDKVKHTYDVGFSLAPKFGGKGSKGEKGERGRGGGSGLVFAVDFRDALDQYGVNFLRRVNVGLELNFKSMLYLRAGVTRGYWTGGIGFASKLGSLDIGSYAEELDARKWQSKEDRRYSLSYGSRF